MAFGTGESAESILTVVGPNASVIIGGNLRMAENELGEENPGSATLHAVITTQTHTTVTVGQTATISNGNLLVELSGYTPQGGEAYQLITAGAIEGSAFASTTLPQLPEGLSWNLIIDPTSVLLRVSLPGDFNNNGQLDAEDIDLLSAAVRQGGGAASFDLNQDGAVNDGDRVVWIDDLKHTYVGDSNLDGEFSSTDLVAVFTVGEYEDSIAANSGWADGDWDGNGDFDSSDFVAAFTAGGYELGPRAAVSAVPEPSSFILLAMSGCGLLRRRNRNEISRG